MLIVETKRKRTTGFREGREVVESVGGHAEDVGEEA